MTDKVIEYQGEKKNVVNLILINNIIKGNTERQRNSICIFLAIYMSPRRPPQI